jgi:hypothetical protein
MSVRFGLRTITRLWIDNCSAKYRGMPDLPTPVPADVDVPASIERLPKLLDISMATETYPGDSGLYVLQCLPREFLQPQKSFVVSL